MIQDKELNGLIKKEYRREMREYFITALDNPFLPNIYDDKTVLAEKICGAFWEDVLIEADMKKIINFSNQQGKVDSKYSHHCYEREEQHYLFIHSEKMMEKIYKIEGIEKNVKKVAGNELWMLLEPFFLYLLPDVDDNTIRNFRIDTFSTYNYIFFLGLYLGKNSDRTEMTIMEAFLDEALERIGDLYKSDKEKSRDVKGQIKKLLIPLNASQEYFNKITEITKAVLLIYEHSGKRTLGNRVTYSDNFECMKYFMQNTTDGRSVNKSYVVFCFNLLTDWYNYFVYLSKSKQMAGSKEKNKTTGYTDISIMDYEGLALKKVAYDVFCIANCVVSNKLNKNFWENTEKKRQEMLDILDGSWNPLNREYENYCGLYNDIVNDKIYLGNKRELLEYWIYRFGEGLEDQILLYEE